MRQRNAAVSALLLLVVFSILIENTNTQNATLYRIGCSDGTREFFPNITKHPLIAGCSGAWTRGGVKYDVASTSFNVTCNRQNGNTGVNRLGTGCSAPDLCAEGWHICT
jgi:hypothetical protein